MSTLNIGELMITISKCAESSIKNRSKPNLVEKDHLPIAIVSGDNIYIVDPSGSVSAIKKSGQNSLKTKQLLARCYFWGDLATF